MTAPVKIYQIGTRTYWAEKLQAGRYDIMLQGTGRVGEVSGKAGSWAAFHRGTRLTSYNKIEDAICGIDNAESTKRQLTA